MESRTPLSVDGDASALAAFEALPAAVWSFDGPDHVIVAANAAARASVGNRPGLLGRAVRDALPELGGQQLFSLFEEVYRTGRSVVSPETRALLDSGGDGELRERFYTFAIFPRTGPDGTCGVMVHATDVTEAAQARRRVEAGAADLTQRLRAVEDVVVTMQRSLLPATLPVLPGIRIAAHYRVATRGDGAGGDWFDAVPLDGGAVGLVVGDAVGRGAAAAAVMGQLRAVLLGFLLEGADVAEALARLDRIAARIPGARGATVCLGVLDPSRGTLRYATCGHPGPLVIAADGRSAAIDPTGGGPLGVAGPSHQIREADLSPGDLLLLFSDGLIERPGQSAGEGLAALARVASAARVQATPELMRRPVPDRVCELAVERLARRGHDDDITMLAVELTGAPNPPLTIDLTGGVGAHERMRRSLDGWLGSIGAGADDVQAVQLAVHEAVGNALEHGYGGRGGPVRVEAELRADGRVAITVTDRGTWRPPPVDARNRGRGLAMMRGCMDLVELEELKPGTMVLLDRQLGRRPVFGADARLPAVAATDVTVEPMGGGVVAIRGPVDTVTAGDVGRRLRSLSRGGALPLTIDLSGVSHLGSAGIQLLYEFAEEVLVGPGGLRLIAPAGSPARFALTLSGLDRVAELLPAVH